MASHRVLYVEREAFDYPHTRRLMELHRDRPVVRVDSHAEVFYRSGQSFRSQKRSPGLIAAVGRGPLLYEAPSRVCGVRGLPVYYNDQLRNCVYDCDYCFLQGMHPSGHQLVFVNSEDFHREAARRATRGPYWLSVSYLTDILAFEPVLPLAHEWVAFARRTPGVTVEIRTKGEASGLPREAPPPNVVLVWSLSPQPLASRAERGCATLANRLRAARSASDAGWRVRIAVDPVVLYPGWREDYEAMLESTRALLRAEAVEAATVGVFRVGVDFMSRMTAARADSPVLHYPFERAHRVVTYSAAERESVDRLVGSSLRRWLGDEKVGVVHG